MRLNQIKSNLTWVAARGTQGGRTWRLLVACAALAACAPQEVVKSEPVVAAASVTVAQAPAPAPPAPPPAVAIPYDDAVKAAARDLFAKAQLPEGQNFNVVIDPLVDGTTGMQSVATATMEKQVVSLVASEFPRFQVKPLNGPNLTAAPLVFIGTFTPINLQGKAAGERDAYRICFALADLKSGKIVSKGFARAQTAGFDATPLPYFRDAPMWVNDPIVLGYIRTCQGTKAGDPINPAYFDKVSAVAGIDEAMRAYNSGKYKESLALFTSLVRSPGGEQTRVRTGIYLSNLKLGRRDAALQEFAKLASQGLTAKRLAVRFGFQSGGAGFAKDTVPYDRWLKELALESSKHAKESGACLEVGGHMGRGGSEALNERLSLQRAEYVKQRLLTERKDLAGIVTAKGYGSSEALVATGRGDPFDALDHRIEFKSGACPAKS